MDDKYNIYMIGFYLTNIIVFTDLYLYMSLKMLFWNQKSTPDASDIFGIWNPNTPE